MKDTVDESFGTVRENCTLVNKGRLLNLLISTTLYTLKNIDINKKTEMKPIY